jgi:hypothetical protein
MKKAHSFVCALSVLLVSAFLSLPARAASITAEIIGTFDYPEAVSTSAFAINNNNEITGTYSDGAGVSRGFTRTADGQFSAPLVDPDDAHGLTAAFGINDAGTVCGYYWGTTYYHGFFFTDGVYTTYDVPGEINTQVSGINNAGDFVAYQFGGLGFISVGGAVSTIEIPGGTYNTPRDLNINDQVAGFYIDANNVGEAFYSDRNGVLRYPIVAPSAKNTYLYGINDRGMMVGGYYSGSGHNRVGHGLLFVPPSQFVTLDYPGGSNLVLTGINNRGNICGYYVDFAGKAHGILARAERSAE